MTLRLIGSPRLRKALELTFRVLRSADRRVGRDQTGTNFSEIARHYGELSGLSVDGLIPLCGLRHPSEIR